MEDTTRMCEFLKFQNESITPNLLGDRMLPNPDDFITILSQIPSALAIPSLIEKNLPLPESRIGFWDMAALSTAMPKAAIHENRDA